MENIEPNDNLLNTGEAAREAVRMIKQLLAEEKELEAKVQRVADAWDAEHKVTVKRRETIKHVIVKILSSIIGTVKSDL